MTRANATIAALAVSLLALVIVGCNAKPDAAAPATKAEVKAAAPAPKAAPPAPALRDAQGRLTKAGVNAAWDSVYMGAKAAFEPADKKAEAFEAKAGKPAKIEGEKKVWFAVDGDGCAKIELGKDGTKGVEKAPKESCGG